MWYTFLLYHFHKPVTSWPTVHSNWFCNQVCFSNPGPVPNKVWIWGLSPKCWVSLTTKSFYCCNCDFGGSVVITTDEASSVDNLVGSSESFSYDFTGKIMVSFNNLGMNVKLWILLFLWQLLVMFLFSFSSKHHYNMCTSLLFLSCQQIVAPIHCMIFQVLKLLCCLQVTWWISSWRSHIIQYFIWKNPWQHCLVYKTHAQVVIQEMT